MKDSKIEWTDHTFNPWVGCTKVSPGCANCYAEAQNRRWAGGVNWGKGAPRRRTSAANWREPLRWQKAAFNDESLTFGGGHRPRVFCASLADWLDDEVPIEWLADLFHLVEQTPDLDWLLLTKRPQNWPSRITRCIEEAMQGGAHGPRVMLFKWLNGEPPPNVWIGISTEDQIRYDERIMQSLRIPAIIRFLSAEPLLGNIDLQLDRSIAYWQRGLGIVDTRLAGLIHWVIVGGESGPHARPMDPQWVYNLRADCHREKIPFFFKQWGEFVSYLERPAAAMDSAHVATASFDGRTVRRIGKHEAGRLLSGLEYNEVPQAPR